MRREAEPTYVSTAQVARAFGLSVSTVKRWVDEGILPAMRTAGGHRKLLIADVLELARRGDLARADLSLLPQADSATTPHIATDRLVDDLHQALRRGDAVRVRTLILGAFRNGRSIEELADLAIAPAMDRLGRDWEQKRIDVLEEHRASELCAATLYELKAALEQRISKNRPSAVGGAPSQDYSVLPSLLAQMVLLDSGWNAVNLGPNTPYQSFAKAIVDLKPRLLWMSVCHLEDESAFLDGYRDLYRKAEKAGVALAIGGRALSADLRARIPYTTFGDGLNHLAAFARTLHPRPTPPRRGRRPRASSG